MDVTGAAWGPCWPLWIPRDWLSIDTDEAREAAPADPPSGPSSTEMVNREAGGG